VEHFKKAEQNFWDEARVFTSKETFNEGIDAPKLNEEESSKTNIGNDQLEVIRNPNSAGIN